VLTTDGEFARRVHFPGEHWRRPTWSRSTGGCPGEEIVPARLPLYGAGHAAKLKLIKRDNPWYE